MLRYYLTKFVYLTIFMILSVACSTSPTPDANLIKTQVASEVSMQLTSSAPTSIPTLTPRSMITYESIAYDLPPKWCRLKDDLITSFCPNYTGLPDVSIEFSQYSDNQSTPQKIVDNYISGYHDAGFQTYNIKYLDNVPDTGGEPTIVAYFAISHPKTGETRYPVILISFAHNGTIFLIAANLNSESTDDNVNYFIDVVFSFLQSIELK